MPPADQEALIAWLSTPAAYGGVAAVERIDTHSASVFLAGDRAYKLKHAVRYDYLDFSTPELRHRLCLEEVRLNRRTAPGLYLGVRAIAATPDGGLRFDVSGASGVPGGPGRPLDWVVEMKRFDQDTLFDRLAARGALDPDLMPRLADAIAHLHQQAEPRPDQGGRDGMAWVIEGNAGGFAEFGGGVLDVVDRDACARVTAAFRAELERRTPLLERRRRAGYVRWCHGDLHLRNICLFEGQPTLFDAVEFNPQIACGDVLYDLAFLLMDLWRRRLHGHANALFNRYLEATRDLTGLALLPLFLACRAAVRAKTSATAARLATDDSRRAPLEAAAREYLTMAETLLRPAPPTLVAVGGLSGSGKTSMARRLAPSLGAVPGALVVRSDVVRKQLFDRDPLVRLPTSAYAADVTRRVYRAVRARARAALGGGHAVIADAVFASPAERAAIERVARRAGVPFTGVWLEAPASLLRERLQARAADASDATPAVLDRQLTQDLGDLNWRRIEASGDEEAVRAQIARHLGRPAGTHEA